MVDFLERMARGSARRAGEAAARESEADLRRRALGLPDPPELRLHPTGFDVIAEIKRRAPSAGRLAGPNGAGGSRVVDRARGYALAGAAAVSVLTEPDEFDGNLADLRAAAQSIDVPVMRKDFLVRPYQVLESRAAGAGGCLLILRMLDDAALAEMLDAVAEMKMFVLLEAFDEDDLHRAAQAAIRAKRSGVRVMVGLNCRDLATLDVDHGRFRGLCDAFPPDVPRVAESGLQSAQDIAEAVGLGYEVALIGSALMRAERPSTLVAELLGAGRVESLRVCASE